MCGSITVKWSKVYTWEGNKGRMQGEVEGELQKEGITNQPKGPCPSGERRTRRKGHTGVKGGTKKEPCHKEREERKRSRREVSV